MTGPVTERPSVEHVSTCVEYDPIDGTFRWKVRPASHFKSDRDASRWNTAFSGRVCGSKVCGRWVICIDMKKYPATHIAWALAHGCWPSRLVDHIDGNPMNNRLVNLRDVTDVENAQNCKMRRNASGCTGVYQDKWNNWYAQITVRGRRLGLGYFTTFSEARAARKAAEREYGFHPNHGRTADERANFPMLWPRVPPSYSEASGS